MAKISQFFSDNGKVSDNAVTTNLNIEDLPIFDNRGVVPNPITDLVFAEKGTNELYSTSLVIANMTGFDHYIILKLIRKALNNLPSYIDKKSFIPGYYRDDDQELKLMYKLKQDAVLHIIDLVDEVMRTNSL